MARTPGTYTLAGTLELQADAPADARLLVKTKADLTSVSSFPYKYVGMIVSVESEQKAYMLIDADTTQVSSWKDMGEGGGESIQVSVLPLPSVDELGKVYQYIGADDALNNLVHNYFYECVSDGQSTPTYSWEQKNVQPEQEPVQYETLPVASVDYENRIVQYVGADTGSLHSGFFYKCVSDGAVSPTYSWEEVPVQEAANPTQVDTLPTAEPETLGQVLQFIGTTTSDYNHNFFYECVANEVEPVGSEDPSSEGWYELVSGEYVLSTDTTVDAGKTYYEIVWQQSNVQPSSSGGGGSLTKQITAAIDVGGIDTGTVYPVDTPIENILSDLLEPTLYPTLTNPSASLSYSANAYYAVGGTVSALTATLALNRGSINPSYGTSGYRSGAATNYAIATSGADTEYSDSSASSGTFSVPALTRASKGTIVVTGTVSYAAGEQPKDSKGGDYDSPLAAGSVSASKTLTFIQPYYYGISNTATIADFTGLTENVTAKGQKTFNYTTNNQYMVFAYDSSYGNLKTILDGNGFDVTGGWTKSTLTVDGFSYFVYIANAPTTDTNAPFTFKY